MGWLGGGVGAPAPLFFPTKKNTLIHARTTHNTQQTQLIHATAGSAPNSSTVIIVGGVTKVFVAELVEAALEVAAGLGHLPGPLRPAHVAAAFQRLEAEGRGLPNTAHPRRRVRL
jgi:hypothetical protein